MSKLRVNEIAPFSSTGVSVGGSPLEASAIWEFRSTNQGILPPRMTTAQRDAIASPAEGLLIYNLDDGRLEQFTSGQWTVAGNGLSPVMNVLRVVKNPVLNSGDFSSIAAAIASISGASASNPYLVQVGPGLYTEPQINVPPYVFVTGLTMDAVIVEPDNSAHHIFSLSTNSGIDFLSLNNAGPGFAAVYCNDSGDFTLLHKITISDSDIGVWCRSEIRNCFNYLEYVDTTGGRIGIKVEATNGYTCYVNAENFYVFTSDPGNVNPDDGALVTGVGAQFICHASGFEGGTNTHGNAIRANDGALVDMKAVSFRYWNQGLFAENVGSGCDLNITGANYLHNISDFNIAHPGTIGTVNATASEENSIFNASTIGNLSILLVDPDGDLITGGTIKARQPDNTFTDTTTLSNNSAPMGILFNGDINPPVIGFPFTVEVEAGFGYLQKSDGSLKKIVWPGTNFTVAPNTINYLYFDSNGVLHGNSSLPNTTQNIVIGRVVSDGTSILIVEESGFLSTHAGNAIGLALRNGLGSVYAQGSIVSEFGTRQLTVSPGEYYYGERQFLSIGGSPVTFTAFYQDGTGGFVTVLSQTTVDNAFWDDGTGTLAPIGAGNYAKHSIYALGDSTNDFDSEAYFLVYSQAQYTALTLAEQGSLPNPPNFMSDAVTLVASVIVQQGFPNLSEIRDERPLFSSRRVSGVAASTFHHNLQGLNDFDDHLRYLPVNGSRPMTGDLPMGGHNVTGAGTYNGVTVESHEARHLPNGADPLTTAAPITNLNASSPNAVGTANSLARSDHSHIIDTGVVSTQTPDQANAAGSSPNLARADHIHNIPTAAAVGLNANSANTQGAAATFSRADHTHAVASGVVSTQTPDQVNGAGTSTNFARADHVHNIPTAVASGLNSSTTNTQGVAASFSRSDHTHSIASGVVSTQTPDQANAAGTSVNFALADHVHNIPTASAVGLNANSTSTQGSAANFARSDHTHAIASGVVSTQTPDQTNAAGTSTNFARADHIHNIPSGTPATTLSPATTNARGVAASFALSDHTHAIATSLVGDITSVQAGVAAAAGVVDKYARGDHKHNISTAAVITQTPDQANAEGASSSVARADHVHNIPTAIASGLDANSTSTQGAASSFARADHTHAIASGAAVGLNANSTSTAGVSANFVRADHTHAIASGVVSTQNPDQTNAAGTSTNFARADHVHNIPTAIAVSVAIANAQGTSTSFARADHTHQGIHSLTVNGGTQRVGDQNLKNGNGVTVVDDGAGNFTFDTIGGPNELVVTAGSGLVANYTAGKVRFDGTFTQVAAGTITLVASQTTGRIYVDTDGTVKQTAGGVAAPPYTVILAIFSTGVSTITSISDHRTFLDQNIIRGLVADIVTIVPNAAAAAGSTNRLADAGHTHAIATASAVGLNANSSSAEGAATSFARSDHTHAIASGTPSAQTPDQANATGTSTNFARADHIHNIATAAAVGLNANSTSTQGTSTSFARADHTHAISSGVVSTQTPDQANAAGTSANFARADHIHNIPSAIAGTISSNANTRGVAASFALSDHTHQLTAGTASLDHLPQYDGSNWQPIYPEAILSTDLSWVKTDDFMANAGGSGTVTGELSWDAVAAGGGSSIAANNAQSDSNHPGIIRITGSGGSAGILLNSTNFLVLGGGTLTMEWLVQIVTLSTGAAEYSVRVGIGDSTSADFTNGVYFEYTRTTSTNWLIKTAAAGTRTSTTTTTAVAAGSWVKLGLVVNAAGTSVTYFINDVSVGTISTNIPTATTNFAAHQVRSLGAPTGFDIDYFNVYQRFTTPR